MIEDALPKELDGSLVTHINNIPFNQLLCLVNELIAQDKGILGVFTALVQAIFPYRADLTCGVFLFRIEIIVTPDLNDVV
jgi:hypothetical protein